VDKTTQIAALVAAVTGLVAAGAGVLNLLPAARRDRPGLKVSAREWSADRRGDERYIEVTAVNARPRQISVVEMGLQLRSADRTWKLDDGTVKPGLSATLEDGEVVTMSWLREELGEEFWKGDAKIVGCFAIDGRNREVHGRPPRER
jgi:hypothetical protein